MSFTSAETAVVSEPIELLFFAREEEYWAYALHDVDVVRGGITYRALIGTRTAFQQGDELNQIAMSIQLSTQTELGAILQNEGIIGTSGPLFVRLFLTHANDTATITPFFGQVIDVTRHGHYVELNADSTMSLMKRKLLRFSGGVQCGHALGDSGCGVNMENFKIVATVASITGRNVVVGALPGDDPGATLAITDYYAGGELVYGRERYFIEHSVLDVDAILRMEGEIPAYILGQEVVLYAGCDRSYGVCKERFSNTRNFGGFPEFPIVSPFDGSR